MNFYSYFAMSLLVVAGIVTHAYVAHEQFYPAVVYLSTDKMCVAVMYNFAFALFLLFGKLMLRLFIGTLRDLEVEQLVDSGRGFLADTILFLVFYAPTIDNREVGTVYLIQYICCVIFMKVFHLTTQIRVSHMFEVGIPRFIVNVKLVCLMFLLITCDVLALQYFYNVASRSSTFFTWILFEALTMSTVVVVSICKYSAHMVDIRLDSGWPGKSVCLFYIDLIHDVVSMTLFLIFMLTFFFQNPSRLPIYMMADVIQVARKLAQRLRSFRLYRKISLTMDARFPDATDEEIERDEYCVICRDSLFEGSKPKKLPCNHIFHIDCLRSWLVMQQVCPTCRAEISADAPSTPTAQPQVEVPAGQGAPQEGQAPAQQPAAAPSVAATPSNQQQAGTTNGQSGPASQAPAVSQPRAEPERGQQASASSADAAGTATSSTARIDLGHVFGSGTASLITLAGIPGAGGEGLPSLGEIQESLKQADDISKFMQRQTEYWMEQVRLIEQAQQAQSAGSASAPAAAAAAGLGFGMMPPSITPLLAAAGLPLMQTPPKAPPVPPAAVSSDAPADKPTIAFDAAAAITKSEVVQTCCCPAVPEYDHEPETAADTLETRSQLEELRKERQERWKRTNSTDTAS